MTKRLDPEALIARVQDPHVCTDELHHALAKALSELITEHTATEWEYAYQSAGCIFPARNANVPLANIDGSTVVRRRAASPWETWHSVESSE